MFRQFVAILLIFSSLGLLTQFSVPYLWYYSNYQYIASELCINRHNPNSDCNGSCQLKKMVEHHADDHGSHDGATTVPNDIRPFLSLYYQQSEPFSFSDQTKDQTWSSFVDLLKTQHIQSPSTPPPISVV